MPLSLLDEVEFAADLAAHAEDDAATWESARNRHEAWSRLQQSLDAGEISEEMFAREVEALLTAPRAIVLATVKLDETMTVALQDDGPFHA